MGDENKQMELPVDAAPEVIAVAAPEVAIEAAPEVAVDAVPEAVTPAVSADAAPVAPVAAEVKGNTSSVVIFDEYYGSDEWDGDEEAPVAEDEALSSDEEEALKELISLGEELLEALDNSKAVMAMFVENLKGLLDPSSDEG